MTSDLENLSFELKVLDEDQKAVVAKEASVSKQDWTNAIFSGLSIEVDGDYTIEVIVKTKENTIASQTTQLTISSGISVPKVLFGDLHVHSNDTVGTESSIYNFS